MRAALGVRSATLRLAAFVLIFAALAVAESIRPRRRLTVAKPHRFFAHLALVALDTGIARLIGPLAPFAMAVHVDARRRGP